MRPARSADKAVLEIQKDDPQNQKVETRRRPRRPADSLSAQCQIANPLVNALTHLSILPWLPLEPLDYSIPLILLTRLKKPTTSDTIHRPILPDAIGELPQIHTTSFVTCGS